MIRETIITTQSDDGHTHIAPMGIHQQRDELIIMPFRPSTTLDNILGNRSAVINYTDDVRVFAGCLTGRREWPLKNAQVVQGKYLATALSHSELELLRTEDDKSRPKLFCKIAHEVNHAPFRGFNRAQFAVIEAAILVSRLQMLPWTKIQLELEYLKIGLDKTAGEREHEAWHWLMQAVEEFKVKHPEKVANL